MSCVILSTDLLRRNAAYPVVNLNGISAGQSIEGAKVAVADNADVLLREIAAQLAEPNGKIGSIVLQPFRSRCLNAKVHQLQCFEA